MNTDPTSPHTHDSGHKPSDSTVDAIAAAVIITVAILTAILWITGH